MDWWLDWPRACGPARRAASCPGRSFVTRVAGTKDVLDRLRLLSVESPWRSAIQPANLSSEPKTQQQYPPPADGYGTTVSLILQSDSRVSEPRNPFARPSPPTQSLPTFCPNSFIPSILHGLLYSKLSSKLPLRQVRRFRWNPHSMTGRYPV